MSRLIQLTLATAVIVGMSATAFAEEGTTLAGGNNAGAGTNGATNGAPSMTKPSGSTSGTAAPTASSTSTENKPTATGGQPGGNATTGR